MKRPSFQFYPGDWQSNSNLRRCTHAEKGAWLDVMCLLHDQPEYGVLRWPLKEIAQAIGAPMSLLRGLITKGVLKGDDKHIDEPFVYTPRSGRKDGEPVTLVGIQDGPAWYSSRMVRDEYVRTIRGESSRFGAAPDDTPNKTSNTSPKHAPKPPFGDGSSSSSSSSPSGNEEAEASLSPGKPDAVPHCPHGELLDLFAEHLHMLPQPKPELWTGARAAALKARWRWVMTAKKRDGSRYASSREEALNWFRRFFAYVAQSDFLTGRDGKWTGCDLGWLCNESNFAKVVQGNYDNREVA